MSCGLVRLLALVVAATLAGCGSDGGADRAATAPVPTATDGTASTSAGEPLAPRDVEARFRARLTEAGVDLERPTAADVDRTWEVMRDFFSDTPVRGTEPEDGDALLAQYGTYDWGDGEHFELDLTRQLIYGDRGDDDMFQLNCTFRFTPTDELRGTGQGNLWSFDAPSVDAFFADAMRLQGFRVVRETRPRPVGLDVFYGGV